MQEGIRPALEGEGTGTGKRNQPLASHLSELGSLHHPGPGLGFKSSQLRDPQPSDLTRVIPLAAGTRDHHPLQSHQTRARASTLAAPGPLRTEMETERIEVICPRSLGKDSAVGFPLALLQSTGHLHTIPIPHNALCCL